MKNYLRIVYTSKLILYRNFWKKRRVRFKNPYKTRKSRNQKMLEKKKMGSCSGRFKAETEEKEPCTCKTASFVVLLPASFSLKLDFIQVQGSYAEVNL